MDPNSIEAYESLETLHREEMILAAMIGEDPLTDKQIAWAIYGDPEKVFKIQPRLSDIRKAGILEKVGDTQCFWTKKKVRVLVVAI